MNKDKIRKYLPEIICVVVTVLLFIIMSAYAVILHIRVSNESTNVLDHVDVATFQIQENYIEKE